MLQDNEDKRSTQYYVIDEPRPTAIYPDFFSTDFLHATFTFLNKYTFQVTSHNVMQFVSYGQTTQKIYFYLFYVLVHLFLSYYNYCVYYRIEKVNVTGEEVSVCGVALSEGAELQPLRFSREKTKDTSKWSINTRLV
jgi:hypothetical protein